MVDHNKEEVSWLHRQSQQRQGQCKLILWARGVPKAAVVLAPDAPLRNGIVQAWRVARTYCSLDYLECRDWVTYCRIT
jgi:hypothetical protein